MVAEPGVGDQRLEQHARVGDLPTGAAVHEYPLAAPDPGAADLYPAR